MAKGKFSEVLHPRGKDGKFASAGKKLVPTGGTSRREKAGQSIGKSMIPTGTTRREKVGQKIGSKIANRRVQKHESVAAQREAAVKNRTAAGLGKKSSEGTRDLASSAQAHRAKAAAIKNARKGGK